MIYETKEIPDLYISNETRFEKCKWNKSSLCKRKRVVF